MTEVENAIDSLTKSEEYISETACAKMVQSIVSDYQWILNVAIYRIILSKLEDPKQFLDFTKNMWKERAQHILSEDRKRFQDTIIKASMEDGKKLTDNFQDVLNNYTRTIESAYSKSETIVDDLIASLLKKNDYSTENKKENNNDDR